MNPILGGDYPDPTIVHVGDDYYMTHSSFNRMPALTVLHSKDLVNWEAVSFGLSKYLGSVWAPDICFYKGKYYIYFTVSQGNDDFSTWVVTAIDPCGEWSEPVDLGLGGWIDPCHALDEETGQRWLFLSGGHRIRLSDDGLSTVGELEKVYDGWEYPTEWVTEGKHLEGPKMKHIGEWYYWLNAEGGTGGAPTSHMAIVARSHSIDGPWENDPDNPIVHTYSGNERWWSKGHGSLVDAPDGSWYIIYHAYESGFLNNGRQTLMEPVEIDNEGWIVAPTGKDVDKALTAPICSRTSAPQDKLAEFRVGLEWKTYQDYSPERFIATDKSITIKGQGDDLGNSSLLLFPTGEHKYDVSVKIELEGEATAGFTLFYKEKFFVGFGFDKDNTYRWRRGAKRRMHANEKGTALWLKLHFDNNAVSGSYSTDGENWVKEEFGMEVSGYNHNTLDEFQSLMPGVFVYGEGKAKFSEFNYLSLD